MRKTFYLRIMAIWHIITQREFILLSGNDKKLEIITMNTKTERLEDDVRALTNAINYLTVNEEELGYKE